MRLQLRTWPEVEAYLKHADGVIVPIGSTEQHGPTGHLGTDALTAETISLGVGKETGALVGPTIHVGIAQHHMAFPGTITLRPSTLIHVLVDTVTSLAAHGFRRFLFINGHGGSVATVRAGFSEVYGALRAQDPALEKTVRLRLVSWWEGSATRAAAKAHFAERDGSHATASEISVMQFAFPDHPKSAVLDPPLAPSGRFHGAEDLRARYPDGRIGSDPSLANPEAGQHLYDTAVDDLSRLWRSFLEET